MRVATMRRRMRRGVAAEGGHAACCRTIRVARSCWISPSALASTSRRARNGWGRPRPRRILNAAAVG